MSLMDRKLILNSASPVPGLVPESQNFMSRFDTEDIVRSSPNIESVLSAWKGKFSALSDFDPEQKGFFAPP